MEVESQTDNSLLLPITYIFPVITGCKNMNVLLRNKKIPEDFVGKKVFGERNYGIRKGYSAEVGFKGSG